MIDKSLELLLQLGQQLVALLAHLVQAAFVLQLRQRTPVVTESSDGFLAVREAGLAQAADGFQGQAVTLLQALNRLPRQGTPGGVPKGGPATPGQQTGQAVYFEKVIGVKRDRIDNFYEACKIPDCDRDAAQGTETLPGAPDAAEVRDKIAKLRGAER